MDTDSESEPSSDPDLLTSSENKTFHGHDEDNEDLDDSSVPELENEVADDDDINCDHTASPSATEAKAIELNRFERPEPVEVGELTTTSNGDANEEGASEVKVIKITGNLVDSSDSEGEWKEELAQLTVASFESTSNKRQCDLNETVQAPREIDAQCAVPTPTHPPSPPRTHPSSSPPPLAPPPPSTPPSLKVDAEVDELCSADAHTELHKVELEHAAIKTSFYSANFIVDSVKSSAVASHHHEQPILGAAYFEEEGAQCLETCLELGAAAIDEEHLYDSDIRESVECYYSAQDLLEYGHMLSSGRKTPDIESGYFERSESDISRDENETVGTGKIRQRTAPKPRSTQSTKMSESLRAELSRFKAMIETIEKERLSSDLDGRQETIDSVRLAERNYDADIAMVTMQAEQVDKMQAHVKGVAGQQEAPTMTTVTATATTTAQRGYWSTVFGQASQIESGDGVELTLDERFADIQKAHRALELLEDYHSRLSEPQDRALRIAIERVIRIFKSRLFQALLARDFMQAYRHQSQCIQSLVKMLQQLKDENWCLPVMYMVCLDLRILAQRCEELGSSSNKPGEILEKAADCLMSCFRVCAADNRSSDDDTKRLGMLNLVNQLFKVYFRINKLHLCKPLIRAIDSSTFKDSFPLPEQITYKYFVGRKAMFDSDYKSADEFLSFALQNCPRNFPRNKRLILIYLAPVKMLLGYLPKREILERFDLLQFHELAVALKEGNVRKFDEVIQRHEIFFIKCGIYLLVEKLKFIVYRNLFKKVYLIKQTHQLDLGAFRAALQFVGETDMSIDETHCIVANLIFEGKIKGYISHSHNKLVVSKQNPFPPLNTVS